MNYRAATSGQVKQIIDKVVKAIPADSFSFNEAERLLRDGQLAQDIRTLLRRHFLNEPVKVRVPESAFEVLMNLNCEFLTFDELLVSRRVQWFGDEISLKFLSIVGSWKRHESAPKEVFLEVLSFESDKTCKEIIPKLGGMGYRPADFIEASGFLQAQGKTFRNPGRSDGPHGFSVISYTALVEFSRHQEIPLGSVWHVTATRTDDPILHSFGPCDVLVAKL